MPNTLDWTSGSGFKIAAVESAVGGGVTAYFQQVVVQSGLLGVTGQVTAHGTLTAEVKGTLTAQVGTVTAQVVGKPVASVVFGHVSGISGLSAVQVIAAQGAGTGMLVAQATFTNQNGSTGTLAYLMNGSAAIWPVWLEMSGGGAVLSFAGQPLPVSANSALNAACTVSANVHVAAIGWREAM